MGHGGNTNVWDRARNYWIERWAPLYQERSHLGSRAQAEAKLRRPSWRRGTEKEG